MEDFKIFHASDAFFHTKPEEYLETLKEHLDESEPDLVVFTGNMGFDKPPKTSAPTIYVEGDYENTKFAYTEPKTVYIGNYTALIIPHTPEKEPETFIDSIAGEEVDIIITPSAPIDSHFLGGNRAYEVLFDIAYFRSPKILLSGHYKFLPHYQNAVPVKNPRKKICNVFGVNTSYGYIEEIVFDHKLNVKQLTLKRIFNGHGRKIF